MPNSYFIFKQFRIDQANTAMKVTTDGCLFGAWVADKISRLAANTSDQNALDIGTGTGLLALMIRQKNRIKIDAIEINQDAVKEAKANVLASPWAADIMLIHDDVVIWRPSHSYRFIIVNPPFYENLLKSPNHERNTAHHSERLTLRKVVNSVERLLDENGIFFLLLPSTRTDESSFEAREESR